jgi:hypothetical protein
MARPQVIPGYDLWPISHHKPVQGEKSRDHFPDTNCRLSFIADDGGHGCGPAEAQVADVKCRSAALRGAAASVPWCHARLARSSGRGPHGARRWGVRHRGLLVEARHRRGIARRSKTLQAVEAGGVGARSQRVGRG